jgi:NADPH2:quinone reductase
MGDYAMVMAQPGGSDGFEKRAITVPEPGPGQARVRHTAVGLNFLDVYQRSGLYKWPVERDLVVGSEAAGVVEAVGPGVAIVAPGDRVAYAPQIGAYASVRLIAADRLVKLPDTISDEIGGTVMLKGMTAHYLIHSSFRVEPGMTVLVHAAAGGVGLILGQWLAAKGATAIGTAGGPEKVALARSHGYAHVIDYRAEDFAARVKEITGGAGVDVVYDSVGRDTWRGSRASLRVRGMFVCFGQSSGTIEGFTLGDLGAGGSLTATRPTLVNFTARRSEIEERARDLFAAIASGAIRTEVRQRFALADVAEAHAALEGRRTVGATVLVP